MVTDCKCICCKRHRRNLDLYLNIEGIDLGNELVPSPTPEPSDQLELLKKRYEYHDPQGAMVRIIIVLSVIIFLLIILQVGQLYEFL